MPYWNLVESDDHEAGHALWPGDFYAGSESCPPLHAWGGLRDHWLFHLVHQGQGRVRMGGQERSLAAGEGFLVPPDTEVHYRADITHPWQYSWFACAGPVAASCFAACGLGPGAWHYRSRDLAFFASGGVFSDLAGRLSVTRDELGIISSLFQLFYSLRLAADTVPAGLVNASPARPLDDYWDAVQEFIRTSYSRSDARIEQLAAKVGVSRKYLSEIVRQRCGQSPRALLSRFRLERARQLLAETNLGIGAISDSVGFGDQLAFSKAFRQHFGLSPSQWRAERAGKPGTP